MPKKQTPMKKNKIILLFLFISQIVFSQNTMEFGVLPRGYFSAGFETGGSVLTIVPEYSPTGKRQTYFVLRTVPKIAYAPIENLMTGIYFNYEFLNIDGKREQTYYAYGTYIRYYMPFINKLTGLNKLEIARDRIFFFSEIYAERNNFTLLENGDTYPSEKLNTVFYGLKTGLNFRIFKKLMLEFAYVQNFDNKNGDFKEFHKEIGFEYFFNTRK